MRRKLVLGVGLAALVGGTAVGQFASERTQPLYGPVVTPTGAPKTTPAAPSLPGGLTPVGPASTAPVVGGFQPLTPPVSPAAPGGSLYTPTYSSPPAGGAYVPPADAPRAPTYGTPAPGAAPSLSALPINIELPTALSKDHPWALKPEHGAYFIMVKSYVRPAKDSKTAEAEGDKWVSAREMGEALAHDIRETYRVGAYLYEYISEERKAELRAELIAREKARTEYVAQIRALEEKARLQGLDVLKPDNKLRMRKHDHRDQIGVLVGGFRSEEDAKKALLTLKKWPAPKNTALLDKGILHIRKVNDADTRQEFSGADYMNPYETAFVVPNPASAKATQPVVHQGLDPFVVKLNDGRPYSLLKATKGWTLAVKSFTAPVEMTDKGPDISLARKFGFNSKGADVLAAGAEQAEAMAKALRAMKGPKGEALNLDAFVLHTRHASLVTVGQFDAPDDPALLSVKRMLAGMQAKVSEDQTGLRPVMNAQSLFDTLLPIPIPRP